MPFTAGCSFCPYTLTVPDRAMGACVRCPKCGNYFTVAPTHSTPAAKTNHGTAQPNHLPAPAPVPTPPAPKTPAPAAPTLPAEGDVPWWITSPPQPVAAAPPTQPEPEAEPEIYSPQPLDPKPVLLPPAPLLTIPEPPPPPEPSSLPPWINVWGVLAFTLAAAAMLFAAFSLPRYLALSLAGLGVLLGLVGAVVPRDEWKLKDAVWLALGGGFCASLLLLGFTHPEWFNNRWGRDFEVQGPDENAKYEVSLDNETEIKELKGNEPVDASKHAIRQGVLLIRLEKAEVKRIGKSGTTVLLVTLHLENVGQRYIVDYRGQGGGELEIIARDSLGKTLQRRELGSEAEKLGQIRGAVILPTHSVKDRIAVEAPWPGTAHVEIDIPSSAWGREGVCQFTIPNQWIRRE
jgi:hypothetical protein